MSNYKKFNLDTIREKLKNNEYASRTGAMRAIGKTQELSAKDKDKARALVLKHFGDEEPAPKAKKATKKVAKKAAAPKPVKAGKKKAAKKAKTKAAAPAAPAPAKKTKRTPRAQASAPEVDTTPVAKPVAAVVASKLSPEAVAGMDRNTVVLEMGQIISTVKDALLAMEAAKRMFPKASLEHNVELSAAVMTRAVQIIDHEVTKPRLGDDTATPSTAAPARKKQVKRGTRTKAATTTSKPAEEDAAEPASNGAHTDLSEEEQEQLDLARQTQNAAAD